MTDYNHFFSKNAYNINPLILKFKKKKKMKTFKNWISLCFNSFLFLKKKVLLIAFNLPLIDS